MKPIAISLVWLQSYRGQRQPVLTKSERYDMRNVVRGCEGLHFTVKTFPPGTHGASIHG